MPLRSPNAITDITLLGAFKTVLLGYPSLNTAIGINGNPVYLQHAGDMLSASIFPALLLKTGAQNYERSSRSTWMGQIDLVAEYYDRWDQRPDEFDDIFAALALDLERMKANIESNESLAQNNTAYAASCYRHVLTPYDPILRDEAGMKLVARYYTASFHLLPYDS